MKKMKHTLCMLLVLSVLLSLCACGTSEVDPTEPTGTQAPTDPTQQQPKPTDPDQPVTDPVATANPAGVYRCTGIRFSGEEQYGEAPEGDGIEIYDDGMGMIYLGDYICDLLWNIEGNRFTGGTIDESALPIEGTITGDVLEVTFDGMGLRFEKKTQQELGDEAVDFLRYMMEDTPQQFAVAYLGWKESDEDLQSLIAQKCPLLLGSEPYISLIPEERVFGVKGEVYCVVPKDPNMTVTIKRLQDADNVEDMVKEVLFEGQMGEPFLLLANEGDFYQDTQVIFTDSQGNRTLWYPMLGQYYTAHIPDNDDGALVGYDFSYYSEVYPYGFNLWMHDGWDWVEEDYLTKTCWNRYFEVVQGDQYVAYNWSLNLSEDGTGEINLMSAEGTEIYATYTGTWQLTEIDAYPGLSLKMTCTENNAPMELPELIDEEYVVLRAPEEDNILIGIREGQEFTPIFTESGDYCTVWFGAVG